MGEISEIPLLFAAGREDVTRCVFTDNVNWLVFIPVLL